jgi:hypothetical protein
MVMVAYSIKEKNASVEDRNPTSWYSSETVFRQVMAREFPEDLVHSHDEDDYSIDVYDIDGSAVILTGKKVEIISKNPDSVVATKNGLEDKLRYFTLEGKNQNDK